LRVELAERLDAAVATDLKIGASFPTDHPLHAGAPGIYMTPAAADELRQADLVLSLDWVDLAGTLRSVCGETCKARIIQVSLDHTVHGGWSMDHQGLPPVDLLIPADPDDVLADLLEALRATRSQPRPARASSIAAAPQAAESGGIVMEQLAAALRRVVGDRPISLTHLPLGWNGASWPFRHPLDFLGSDGGGGIGAGPGITVGAALALRDSGRLPIGICGDGDFLMGATSLWTAVHYRIPLLIVVANNRSFYNDEVHQDRVARMRGRPVENKWIGQRMADPEIDLAGLALAQGAVGLGPVTAASALEAVLAEALAMVGKGQVAVVDVHIEPGTAPAMAVMPSSGAR
jgi:thiamine pyrophosphate-dependent acetolactate synthase large subunit-like protein